MFPFLRLVYDALLNCGRCRYADRRQNRGLATEGFILAAGCFKSWALGTSEASDLHG
jgi:hypothetical protein